MRILNLVALGVVMCLSWTEVSRAELFTTNVNRNYSIENKYELYHLLAAYAYRTNDLTVCKEAAPYGNGVEECIHRVESYDLLANVANGNCAAIHREPFQILCEGVKNEGKGMDNKAMEAIYNGLKNEDPVAIANATWMPYWAFREEIMDENTARYFLSFFKAYENNSDSVVDKYLNKQSPEYFYEKATFKILFSSELTASDLAKLHEEVVRQYAELESQKESASQ